MTINGLMLKEGIVEASGTYAVSGLPAGDYFVSTALPAYRREIYDDMECQGPVGGEQCDTSLATSVTVTPNTTVNNIDFVLDRGGVITGAVMDEADGQPLDRVGVALLDADGLTIETRLTDGAGTYTFDGLTDGTYFVGTNSIFHYLDEVHEGVICPRGPTHPDCDRDSWTPIPVSSNMSTRIDFALTRLGTLSGIIRDQATGQPLVDVEVEIRDENGRIASIRTTDEFGRYQSRALNPGIYFVATRVMFGYLDEIFRNLPCERRIPGRCPATEGTPVVVVLETDTSGIDFDLAAGGLIAGTLTDLETDEPLVFEQAAVWDQAGRFLTSERSDDEGRYLLTRLATGTGNSFSARSTTTFHVATRLWEEVATCPWERRSMWKRASS